LKHAALDRTESGRGLDIVVNVASEAVTAC